MGLFSFKKAKALTQQKPSFGSDEEIVHALIEVGTSGMGDENASSQPNMDKVLAAVEAVVDENTSSIVLYWLGLVWRNYTAWHIRGDARKPYLEKAADYYSRALERSKSEWPIRQPEENRHNAAYLDQISIASDLGTFLVEEKLIRDLDGAEKVLGFVATSTDRYEPCLCSYAELFYKKGQYEKCAAVALKVHARAVKTAKADWEEQKKTMGEFQHWDGLKGKYVSLADYDWHNLIAPAPLSIAGKALRALGRQAKKDGDNAAAKTYFGKMIELGVASDNDKKIYDKL